MLSVDPNALPKDIDQLQKIVAELCERLKHETSEKDKYRSLLRELMDAERNRKSEQLSKDQLALFETLWKANHPDEEEEEQEGAEPAAEEEQKPEKPETKKRSGRQPLARDLVRERVVHDLAASEKHCQLLLTAETWADRQLGVNKTLQLPVLCDFAITGNNIQLGGDIPRRCYRIKIDAQTDKPYLRTGFKNPNLREYVADIRPSLVACILTMIHAWVTAGRPKPHSPIMGSFARWSSTVGGVLPYAGIKGFLGNLDELLDDSAPEIRETEVLLAHLYGVFGQKPFTTGEVAEYVHVQSFDGNQVLKFIPNDLLEFIADTGKFSMRLGWLFRRYAGRPFGQDGLRVLNAGDKRGANLWRLKVDGGAK